MGYLAQRETVRCTARVGYQPESADVVVLQFCSSELSLQFFYAVANKAKRETTHVASAYIIAVEAVWWRRPPVYVVCGLCCGIPVWKSIHEFETVYAHRCYD